MQLSKAMRNMVRKQNLPASSDACEIWVIILTSVYAYYLGVNINLLV